MENIDYDKLLVLIDLSTLIIDVREKKELAETGVLPNSINIPLSDVGNALSLPASEFAELYKIPKPDAEKSEIVFSCHSGVRSQKAAGLAQKVGYKKVYNYTGGWSEWAEKNLAVSKNI
ncbi:rhodanese domain-containing protein CG4456-like [Adelges cooleyi]|uniref:rhodanese domain-containing protein CG4456-like n=1 Tax=Adelges cooleyi TaxID=133065 RepID=UPI00217F23F6|nr:rhodanese domain-containing protein CG4456-like [Adelges cooleyi]